MTALARRAWRFPVALALAAATVLAVGAVAASAHGGMPGPRGPFGKEADLITPAAKSLGISADSLKKAILDVANAKVDAAVKDDKLDADDAADLKDDLSTHPQLAIRLTSATAVAGKLGITKAKLDDAFRAARKAAIVDRIDQAVKDGKLTSAEAAELKSELEDADLPGYKPFIGFGFGLGIGPGRFGHRAGLGA